MRLLCHQLASPVLPAAWRSEGAVMRRSYDVLLHASSRASEAARVASNSSQMLNRPPAAEFHGITTVERVLSPGNVLACGVVQIVSSCALARRCADAR
jgi:hypothetical protein